MGKNHRPEVTSETASEYPGSLWLVADDGVFRLDAVPPDGKS
jgi:hypothetical protein